MASQADSNLSNTSSQEQKQRQADRDEELIDLRLERRRLTLLDELDELELREQQEEIERMISRRRHEREVRGLKQELEDVDSDESIAEVKRKMVRRPATARSFDSSKHDLNWNRRGREGEETDERLVELMIESSRLNLKGQLEVEILQDEKKENEYNIAYIRTEREKAVLQKELEELEMRKGWVRVHERWKLWQERHQKALEVKFGPSGSYTPLPLPSYWGSGQQSRASSPGSQ